MLHRTNIQVGGGAKMNFKSSFASRLEDFLSYVASLYKKSGWIFYSHLFDEYWSRNDYPTELTKKRLQAWIRQEEGESIARQNRRISLTRQFGRFLQSEGLYEQYVVPEGMCAKVPGYSPHFFTDGELVRFFAECKRLRPLSSAPHQQIVLPQLFSVIYCCGLRPGEARKVLVGDVNLIEGWIDIKGTKTHRDRRLPISKTLQNELCTYDAVMQSRLAGRKYFFPVKLETCYSKEFNKIFQAILNAAGIFSTEGDRIRLYDLRHHFAFSNFNRWITEKRDAGALLPYLQRYMGHSSTISTEYYLHLVPEFFPSFSTMTRSLEFNLPEVNHES
jgi:integrase